MNCAEQVVRESRYLMLLHRKNVTSGGGTDGKGEMTSIWESGGSIVDARTEQSKVAIECSIIEGT